MQLNPSPQVRVWIYVCVVIGTSVIVPLYAAHVVSDVVMAVWTSISGAASLLAGLNVSGK